MAEINLNTRIVLRNDTSANWGTNGTKVLLKGEPIIVWDGTTPKLKIGDGTKTVNDLPWAFINATEAGTLIDSKISALSWVKNVTVTGSGNGLANATYSGGTLTITKGTFLTAHQDISGKVDKINIPAQETLGLYKITYNAQGQILTSTAVAKADITALGIPGSDTNTTYTLITKATDASKGAVLSLHPNSGSDTAAYFKGAGSISVTSDANGNITISGANDNTTYTFAEGTTNGAFSVTPSGGTAQSVKIHGLGTAAYTASTAYATAAQGALAEGAMPKSGGTFTGAPIWATVPTADNHLANKKYVDDTIGAKVTSMFKFKGTKATTADLPTTGNTIGDVWHVEADHTEYVWATVDGALNPSWEALGGTVDLSGYTLKTDLKNLIIQGNGTTAITYNPLTAGTLNIVGGGATTVTGSAGKITISSTDNDTFLADVANSAGKVFTGVTGGKTITTTNVGALVLTGFAANTGDTGAIIATDTITKALNKLYNLANSKTSNTGTVTSVVAGGGLTGGTITTTGTISHAERPTTGGTALSITASGNGTSFVTGITLDTYGHVVSATKQNVSASSLGALTSITAGAGISVSAKSGTTQTISINTTDTYILDGGSAA